MYLDCTFQIFGLSYRCKINKEEISESETEIELDGEHISGKSDQDVKEIHFKYCKMPRLPQTIINNFVNVVRLTVQSSNLKEIKKFDLQQFENLKKLNLNDNELQNLPEDLFEFTPKLEKISFACNQIENISEKVFDNLSNLKEINLSHNKLDNLHENLFKFTTKLEIIKINNNKIKNVHKNAFKNLSHIKFLILHTNELQNLPATLFQFNTKMKMVNFSNNQIENLSGDLFKNTPNLEEFSFMNNKIKFIEGNFLDNFTKLQTAIFLKNYKLDCFFGRDFLKARVKYKIKATPSFQTDQYKNYSLDKLKRRIRKRCNPRSPNVEISSSSLLNESESQNSSTYIQKDYRNFIIKIGIQEFKIHHFILEIESETFANFLKENPKAKVWELENISVETFEKILKFIYTGNLFDEGEELTDHQIEKIFEAAEKLKMERLNNRLTTLISTSIKLENNVDKLYKMLAFTIQLKNIKLREETFFKIQKIKEEEKSSANKRNEEHQSECDLATKIRRIE